MKRLIIYILGIGIALSGMVDATGIYSNGTTSEDSLVVSLFLTDSLGNPSGSQADSFFISVVGPSGDSIVTVAGVASTAGLNIDSLNTTLVGWKYIFADAISEMDGAGRVGTYELVFCAKDNSPEYINCASRSFQLVGDNLSGQLDKLTGILDSVYAVLDSLQNQDNWVAAEASLVTAGEIMDSSSNRGFVQYDSSEAILSLAGLHLRSSGNDTALIATGSGSGHGAYFGGETSSGSGYGLFLRGGGAGAFGMYSYAASGTGAGFVGGGAGSAGLYTEGASYGQHALGHGLSGHGFYIQSDSGDALQLTAGVGDNKHGLEIQGGSGSSGDAVAVRASSSGNGVSITTVGSHGVYIDGGTGNGIYVVDGAIGNVDTAMIVSAAGNNPGLFYGPAGATDTTLIKTVAQNNPDIFYGPTASGSGSDIWTIYAIDTSGSDVAQSDVKISVKNLAGADYAVGYSSSGGYSVFNVDATDTFLITGKSHGFVWPGDDTVIVTSSQTDSLLGYDVIIGSAASGNLCRVYGYFYGIDGLPVEGVSVTARLTDGVARHNALIISPYRRTVVSDTAGYFYLDLIPSDSLIPVGTRYLISADYPSGTVLKKRLLIPDSSSWQMTW